MKIASGVAKIASGAVSHAGLQPSTQFRRVTAPCERLACSMEDESAAMFRDHTNVDTSSPLDQFPATDVVHVLAAILAVMHAFVIQSDHRFVVANIDECLTDPVGHTDLRSRSRQPAVDKDETKPGFLWRLRPRVHQCKCNPCTRQSPRPGVLRGQ